jgi:hypothetical protein
MTGSIGTGGAREVALVYGPVLCKSDCAGVWGYDPFLMTPFLWWVNREYKDDLFRGPPLSSVDGAQQLPGGKLAPGYLPSVQAAREPIRPAATGWKADEAKWRNDYKGPPGVIPTPGM